MHKESYRNLAEKFNADPDARELFWTGVLIGAMACCALMLVMIILFNP